LLDQSALKELLHKKEFGRKDKALLVLAVDSARPKSVGEIKDIAWAAGLRAMRTWNVSDVLGRGAVQAIRTDEGWELNAEGKKRVAELAGTSFATPVATAALDLRAPLAKIKNPDIVSFVGEAITCLELQQLRAAVVLSWVGAVAVLYDEVVTSHLPAFNAEAARRDPKWKAAKTTDDLSRMKEFEFLNILESISAIGKNVRQELQNALQLRNSCGHPNSLKIGSSRVASHIEILLLNVFSRV
jgi:hypothetical protein